VWQRERFALSLRTESAVSHTGALCGQSARSHIATESRESGDLGFRIKRVTATRCAQILQRVGGVLHHADARRRDRLAPSPFPLAKSPYPSPPPPSRTNRTRLVLHQLDRTVRRGRWHARHLFCVRLVCRVCPLSRSALPVGPATARCASRAQGRAPGAGAPLRCGRGRSALGQRTLLADHRVCFFVRRFGDRAVPASVSGASLVCKTPPVAVLPRPAARSTALGRTGGQARSRGGGFGL